MRESIHKARRARILDAATQTFTEFGYERAKVEAIALDAGVSTATVYNYFKTKPAIFAAMVERVLAPFEGLFDTVEYADLPVEDGLMSFVTVYWDFMADPHVRGIYRTVSAEVRREPHLGVTLYAGAHRLLGGALRRVLQRYRAAGHLSFDDVSIAARLLQGMVEHPTLTIPLLQGDDAPPLHPREEYCREAVAAFLCAYGASEPKT